LGDTPGSGADKPKKPRRRKPATTPDAQPAEPTEQF
jgi:hypothetical protein